jgi:hypothetical protein
VVAKPRFLLYGTKRFFVFGDLKKSGAWVRERPVPERPPTYCVFGIYYFVISDLSDLDDFEESGQPTRLGSLGLDSRQQVPRLVGPHGLASDALLGQREAL